MAGKIELRAPLDGIVSLVPEDTASDFTVTIPAVTGELLNDQSDIAAGKLTGNVAAARITNALNASGSAPIYACRAWVNFDGTTTPPTIRASGNVSSVTRNGTGDYTINFTTAMPDGNYSCVGSNGTDVPSGLIEVAPTQITTSQQIFSKNGTNNTNANQTRINVAFFR